jgi:thiol-disulfide isomerase/thioredoxin
MRAFVALIFACVAGLVSAQQLRPWNEGATPPLALPDLEGRELRLENFRGRVVLVNFWATWCEPCREEMPSMNRLRASLAGQPFEVLAVNLGEPETRVRRFMEQVPLDFPVLLDRENAAARAWRARVLPASYVVGPDGRIRYAAIGGLDWSQEAVRKRIVALLPKEAAPPRAEGREATPLPVALSASSP